jgi:hypothetical protein
LKRQASVAGIDATARMSPTVQVIAKSIRKNAPRLRLDRNVNFYGVSLTASDLFDLAHAGTVALANSS